MSERTIIPSDHDALVDEHTWDTVQEILDRHTKVKPCTSVSGLKYLSSLPIFSSTAALNPGVTSMFLPTIINFMLIIPSKYLFTRFYVASLVFIV